MNNKKLSLVLFDFHNVLSRGRFYSTIEHSHPEIYKKIMQRLFAPESYDFIAKWMRGELSYEEVHAIISDEVGASVEFLNESLITSVKQIELNSELFEFSQKIRSSGVLVAVLTDNMDIFSEVYVPYMGLDKKFDHIFSSSVQKKLKLDNNGEFIFDAISYMKVDVENTLFIDDFIDNGTPIKNAGGLFYHYDKYVDGHRDFLSWFENSFQLASENTKI